MTLKQLHGLYNVEDVLPYIYEEQHSITSYRVVYEQLGHITPDTKPDNEFSDADVPRDLVLRVLPAVDHVYGYTVLHDGAKETWYNLYYDSWSYWLSRNIYANDLKTYVPELFLAKCLESMTAISCNETEIALERAKILSNHADPQM